MENLGRGKETLRMGEKPREVEKALSERHRVSIDADHDLVLEADGYGLAKIRIENKGDKHQVIDFEQLYKPKYAEKIKFHLQEEWVANAYFNNVTMPADAFKDPRDAFILLHEIGHIVQADEHGESYSAKSYAETSRAHWEGESANLAPITLEVERDAWAAAIRLARKIKQEYKVDLFALFKDPEEFMGYIRDGKLRTYEADVWIEGEQAFSKGKFVEKWLNTKVD